MPYTNTNMKIQTGSKFDPISIFNKRSFYLSDKKNVIQLFPRFLEIHTYIFIFTATPVFISPLIHPRICPGLRGIRHIADLQRYSLTLYFYQMVTQK